MMPMKKLSPIANALAVVSLEGAEREAALRLPLKEAVRDLGKVLHTELEEHLLIAVRRYLGQPEASMESVMQQIAGRFTLHPDPFDPDEPQAVRGETYAIDSNPVLWAGPIAVQRFGDAGDEHVRANRPVRYLV